MFFAKNKLSVKLIISLAFSLALVEAISSYVQSSYLSSIVSLSQVALIFTVATSLTIVMTAIHPALIIRRGNYYSAIFASTGLIVSHFALSFCHQPWIIISAFILRYICLTLLFLNLDVALESISNNQETGRIRTEYLTAINLAWLASPLIMSNIVDGNHYARSYGLGLIVATVLFFLLLFNRRALNQKLTFDPKEINWLKSLLIMFKRTNLRAVYLSSLVLQMFFALAVLYIPIYLHQNLAMPWSELGWVFTAMLIPFVILQYPAGLIADKLLGEKELLISGIAIIACCCVVIYLTNNTTVWFWAILLFASRVGAALAESMQEVYFFKQVDVADIGLINLFRQTRVSGWLLGTLLASALLTSMSIPGLFLVMAGILCLNLWSLRKIVDTR